MTERQRARRNRKRQLAQQQKLVFAALFLVSLIIISPFLVSGLVKQNRQKKLVLAQQQKIAASQQGGYATAQKAVKKATQLPQVSEAQAGKFFQNTLFIGDSRTVGLREYGGMDTADFFCDVGLGIGKATTTTLNVPRYGNTTLGQLLGGHKYRRIYIMLGINEMANPRPTVLKHYRNLVEFVKEREPGAQIILVGNLHVTAEKSASDPTITNGNIDGLNRQIAQIAWAMHARYLDPNPSFDDASGNLPANMSGDGAHLYGKYYTVWKNWFVAEK